MFIVYSSRVYTHMISACLTDRLCSHRVSVCLLVRKALVPLMHDDTYAAMHNVIQTVDRNEQLGKTRARIVTADTGAAAAAAADGAGENQEIDAPEAMEDGALCPVDGYFAPCFALAGQFIRLVTLISHLLL